LYNNDLGDKAATTSVVASITRSGTTFTAKNSAGTQLFTFTQQDNNTTTGTTYNAGSCPDNTTFGTNGSIARAYKAARIECTENVFDITVGANTTAYIGDNVNCNKSGYTPIFAVMTAGDYGDNISINQQWHFSNGTAACRGYIKNWSGGQITVKLSGRVIWRQN